MVLARAISYRADHDQDIANPNNSAFFVQNFNDVKVGDVIEAYKTIEVAREA